MIHRKIIIQFMTPLAERMRPKSFEEFVGQEHLVGENGIIKKLLKGFTGKSFPSLIFWGPPGTGKTTLARIIASELKRPFFEFSAVNTSIKEVQEIMKTGGNPLVFIDEIHRFNKAQQDRLLPYVERGEIIIIGATTENPSFEVIGPLLSRTRVLVLKQLTTEDLEKILGKAQDFLERDSGQAGMTEEAKKFLLEAANGDARVLLNVLEIAAEISKKEDSGQARMTVADLEEALQRRQLSFDLKGEEFYNTISALHKAIRGSDADGALYYLARMLEAGQDPLYIARRLIRAASEDIGLADFRALLIAVATFQACERLGLPECGVNLAQCVSYLAMAKKSNAVYLALGEATEDVRKYGNLPVPFKIRNPVTKLMKDIGYGKNYEPYAVGDCLPEKLKGKKYLRILDAPATAGLPE